MLSRYVVITDAEQRKLPPVCRKGPHRASSGRYHFVTTVGSTYTGLEDKRSGSGPVSYTDGRKASAVVSKLYLPSVGRKRYSAGTDGLFTATVYQT